MVSDETKLSLTDRTSHDLATPVTFQAVRHCFLLWPVRIRMHKTKRMVTNCSVERRLSSGIQRDRALGQGVVGYLTKPIDEKVLLGCVESALRRAKSNENPS